MQFPTTISTILAILSTTALGAPAPQPEIAARDSNPDNTCHSNSHGVISYVITLTDDRSIDDTCGGGILDNVRGRCGGGGAVTGWGCNYVGPTGASMSFDVGIGCNGGDVAAAILAAGGPSMVCS